MPDPKLTEAQARRICAALGRLPTTTTWAPASQWPKSPRSTVNPDIALVPLWRIVQRAAEEG